MSFFKKDVVIVNGKIVSGEEVIGNQELRMQMYVEGTITSGGKTYAWNRRENGENVYVLINDVSEKLEQSIKTKFKGNRIVVNGVERDNNYEMPGNYDAELPEGYILDNDWVGGIKRIYGKEYRLMQPITKRNGKFVYVPVKSTF